MPRAPDPFRFSQLSASRQLLVRLFQELDYGSVQVLEVRDSDPVFSPPPMVLADVKLDMDIGPRPEIDLADFALRQEVCRLMAQLDGLRSMFPPGIRQGERKPTCRVPLK